MPRPQELLDSALEFLRTSCDLYTNRDLDEPRRLKHSTINIYSGIELVLRARLAQEHWTLVLQNADRYRQGDWDRGSFESVWLRDAIARLSEVCGVSLSQQADSAFSDLASLRNKYVHFAPTESAERVTGIQLRAWHHLLDLFEHDFLKLDEPQDSVLQMIRTQMQRREEFLARRFEEVRPKLDERAKAGADLIMCPFCAHPALVVGDGAQCLVCGAGRNEPREYAEEYARRSAPWMSSDEYYNTQWAAVCSECKTRACVAAPDELSDRCEEELLDDEDDELDPGMGVEPWYCFNCGSVYDSFDIVECTRCGQLFARNGDQSLCPTCSW